MAWAGWIRGAGFGVVAGAAGMLVVAAIAGVALERQHRAEIEGLQGGTSDAAEREGDLHDRLATLQAELVSAQDAMARGAEEHRANLATIQPRLQRCEASSALIAVATDLAEENYGLARTRREVAVERLTALGDPERAAAGRLQALALAPEAPASLAEILRLNAKLVPMDEPSN